MDDPEEINPHEFATLPEELKAKIIRTGIGKIITKKYAQITLDDRITDACNKPFSKDEIEWLLHKNDKILIFFELDYYMEMYTFAKIDDELWKIIDVLVSQYSNELFSYYHFRINFPEEMELLRLPIRKEYLVDKLVNRFDTKIIKETRGLDKIEDYIIDSILVYMDYEDIFFPVRLADIVLLDIRSIYFIFKERFEIIGINNPEQLARECAQRVLNNILNDMQDYKMPALLGYLVKNVSLLSGESNLLSKYLHFNTIEPTEEYLQDVTYKCSMLYQILTDYISDIY